MRTRVYSQQHGSFLLVPDCMVASAEAEHKFGPLQDWGCAETDHFPADLKELIEREFDARSYALLPDEVVDRLGLSELRVA